MIKYDYKKYSLKEVLNKKINLIKDATVIINNDIPFFSEDDFKILEGEPNYEKPDKYGRSSGATAIISSNTRAIISNNEIEYPDPEGWTGIINYAGIFERCHIIAYSLSARLSTVNNIFIGTYDLNHKIMKVQEDDIRNYIDKEKKKGNDVQLLYRVTPKYYKKEAIPRGVLIELKGINCELELCRFCYNIQEGNSFNYNDGKGRNNKSFLENIKDKIKSYKRKANISKKEKGIYKDYIINIKSNEYHLMWGNCKLLKGVDKKYLQETTASKKDLKNKGKRIKRCKYCTY